MLDRADYRAGWEKKLAWYRSNGVVPVGEGEGSVGALVTTIEGLSAGFDVATVHDVIRKHFS
jgi:hypothetical protein